MSVPVKPRRIPRPGFKGHPVLSHYYSDDKGIHLKQLEFLRSRGFFVSRFMGSDGYWKYQVGFPKRGRRHKLCAPPCGYKEKAKEKILNQVFRETEITA